MGLEFIEQITWGMSEREERLWYTLMTTVALALFVLQPISVLWYLIGLILWGLIRLTTDFKIGLWLALGAYMFITWMTLYVVTGFIKKALALEKEGKAKDKKTEK